MEKELIIKNLFIYDDRQFVIPSFQRAYSWEEKQFKQFLDDIKEQNPDKDYFLGHFLFGNDDGNKNRYFVIDGQQRLTTVVIFFGCLYSILKERIEKGVKIIDEDGVEFDLDRMKDIYLQRRKNRKLKTVDYDDNYFDNLVIQGNFSEVPNTKQNTESKERIRNAWDNFNRIM